MTNAEMIASLTALSTHGAYFDDDQYLDWSSTIDGGRRLEVGDGADCVQLELSHAQLVQLHAALTATLLGDAA
jgi:hypothetical protein